MENPEEAQETIPGFQLTDAVLPVRAPRHRVRSRRERATRGRRGADVRTTSVSLPVSVATDWRQHSQAIRRSLVDVLLDAVQATLNDLPALVQHQQNAAEAAAAPVMDGMFLRSAEIPPAEPVIAVSVEMLASNLDKLDDIAAWCRAKSRSQLLTVALAAYLANVRDQRPATRLEHAVGA